MGGSPGLSQSAPSPPPTQQRPPASTTPGALQPSPGAASPPAGIGPLPVAPQLSAPPEGPRTPDRRDSNGFFDPAGERGPGQSSSNAEGTARPSTNPGRIEIVVQPPGGSQSPAGGGAADGPRVESQNHAEMAMDLQMKGDYKRAAQAWERALDGAGDDRPSLHQKAAVCYQRLNDAQAARRHFTEAIRGYRAQIEAGKDVDRARLGLQACEAGLAAIR